MNAARASARRRPQRLPGLQRGRIGRALLALGVALLLAATGWALREWQRVPSLAADEVPIAGPARVVSVDDGDSFVVELRGRGRVHVRLHAVDAPELLQAHGLAARSALLEILAGGELQLDCYKVDPRGRAVCRAAVAGRDGRVDIGLALVERGLAWHFKAFASEQTADERRAAQAAEARARAARRGLWAQQEPMAPWDCRARLRGGARCT